eukprot:c7823_g1_i1.p1 GENE.c7823_g1_i1~~c7823_g1_i1.p1  ORF type:complete len:342 (-),score=142.18 c7823_g1_i1:170-1195(-)
MSFAFVPIPAALPAPYLFDQGEEFVIVQWTSLGSGHEYEMQWKESSSQDWTTVSSILSNSVVKKKGLSSGKQYQFRVRARVTNGGWSEFSPSSEPISPLLDSKNQRMEPPTLVEAAYNSVTLTWNPANQASLYQLQYRGEDSAWVTAQNKTSENKLTCDGLSSGKKYQFRVRPEYPTGWDNYSSPSDFFLTISASPFFHELLGETLIDSNGNQYGVDILADKLVGIYFVSRDSTPCQLFTPQLTQFYSQLQSEKKNIIVVLVSLDPDSATFDDHFRSLPFLAVPITETNIIEKAKVACLVDPRFLPKLIIYSSSGKLIEKSATSVVLSPKTFSQWEEAGVY